MAKSYIRYIVNGLKKGSHGDNTSNIVCLFNSIARGNFSLNPYICTNVKAGDKVTAELYRGPGKTYRGKVEIDIKEVTPLAHGFVEITESSINAVLLR
jgi:hypothetical protein